MNIFEIDQSIMALIDPESGEISDFDAFEALQMARDAKVENMAMWYKQLVHEAASIKEEEANLRERRQSKERKAESLKEYLDKILGGNKFETPRCAISYRKSSALEISDETNIIAWAETNGHKDCVKYAEPTVSKKAVTDLLKSGVEVPCATLETRQSVQIK